MDDRVNQAETIHDERATCPCSKASDPPELFYRYMFVKPLEATQEMTDYLMTLHSDLAANEAFPSRLWMDWWKQSESMFASWSDSGATCRARLGGYTIFPKLTWMAWQPFVFE